MVLVGLVAVPVLHAQATDSTINKGPTLAETVAWLMSDATPLLAELKTPYPRRTGIYDREIRDLRIQDCRMTWTDSHVLFTPGTRIQSLVMYTAQLADLDVGGIRTKISSDTSVIIELGPRVGRPAMFYVAKEPRARSDSTRRVSFSARNEDDGKRVVAALKRAATLCGAPASPF